MAEEIGQGDHILTDPESVDCDKCSCSDGKYDEGIRSAAREERRGSSHIPSNYSSQSYVARSEEKMRKKLRFFFMNPIEKWQAKRRFPYKFIVQVIKIILVTVQLCLFAHNRYNHVNYTWDNHIAFSHLFLKGWDPTREVNAYPPGVGPLALYQIPEFYATIDYAVERYSKLENAIGPYSYTEENNTMPPPVLCLYQYKEGTIYGFNESYIFNSEIDEKCMNMTPSPRRTSFSSKSLLEYHQLNIEFSALVKATLSFSIKTVNFKAAGPITPPDCYKFNIEIIFDNRDHDGQMLLSLDADAIRLYCKGDIEYTTDNRLDTLLRSILNSLVILICSISLVLCSRAIYRAQQLKWETTAFFKTVYGKELSVEGRLEFLNMWYIMIIINDILIIMGSAIKEQIERQHFGGDQWNICGVLLGTGNLLVWFGVLRYLGFFKTYNVVILTLKKAAPKVSRFLLCALLIYAGFTFCGWLILGPYHMKFRSLASTSECLFALINGDDMYATFSIMSYKSPMLWWYSRIYLYCFISLYIYVVLSLFISVIIDAYDTIKLYYKNGFPKSDVLQFVTSVPEQPFCATYRRSSSASESFMDLVDRFCYCCKRKKKYASFEYNGQPKYKSQSSNTMSAICV
ncbi:mucolipin-3 [Anabrus simplex]|uniref:mucolipin-3 n=1 Tax=Anabrus simplex TaxID=316456 RepID=UPI0035A35C4B